MIASATLPVLAAPQESPPERDYLSFSAINTFQSHYQENHTL